MKLFAVQFKSFVSFHEDRASQESSVATFLCMGKMRTRLTQCWCIRKVQFYAERYCLFKAIYTHRHKWKLFLSMWFGSNWQMFVGAKLSIKWIEEPNPFCKDKIFLSHPLKSDFYSFQHHNTHTKKSSFLVACFCFHLNRCPVDRKSHRGFVHYQLAYTQNQLQCLSN